MQARFGGLDVLVNCAGMAQSDAFEDITPARFDEIMTLNCRTPFFLCQKALPLLRQSQAASILNIASVTAHKGYVRQAAYAASKHAMAGFTKTLAAEVYTPVLYLITALLLALCLPLSGGFRMPLSALPYMAGLVIGSTLLGHAVFAYALSGVSANVISFALLGEPVGAMIFSMIFFGEVPTWPVALGGLLTLMGLALYLAFAGGEKQPA